MIRFLLLIGLWLLITALFHWLGKRSIANLSERKLIEIIASPIFTKSNLPRHKVLHWSVVLLLVLAMFAIILSSFFTIKFFSFFQKILFNTPNGIFIPHELFLFFIVFFGIGFAALLVVTLFLMRKTPPIPLEKWDNFPSIESIHKRIRNIRNIGFLLSAFLQTAFIFGMYDYVIIEPNRIIRNSIGSLNEEIIPMSKIQKATITYAYHTESKSRSTVTKEVLTPKFYIHVGTDSFNIWQSLQNFSDSTLYHVAARLYQSNVTLEVNYPGVMEKYKWKAEYSETKYNALIAFFGYVNLLQQNLAGGYKIGEKAITDELEIQVDSVVVSNRANIFSTSKATPLLVYFTVKNTQIDTTYFGTLSTLNVVDNQDNSYTPTFLIYEIGSSGIAPQSTVQIMRGFDVPTTAKGLKLQHRLNIMNEEYVTFWLE